MKTKDIDKKSDAELNLELSSLKEELFNLRFQNATGQLQNPLRIREVRRDYAQIKTILRERELGLHQRKNI